METMFILINTHSSLLLLGAAPVGDVPSSGSSGATFVRLFAQMSFQNGGHLG